VSVSILLPDRRRAWHARLATALGAIEGDVVIDLSESGAGAGAGAGRLLRPLYDGSPDSAFLLGRLQRRECPYLEIVDGKGETLVASYAAIEDKGDLAPAADQAFARVEALLLRALAGQASPIPPRPERPPARYSRSRALKAATRRLRWTAAGAVAEQEAVAMATGPSRCGRQKPAHPISPAFRSRRLAAAAGRSRHLPRRPLRLRGGGPGRGCSPRPVPMRPARA
jgi:hypothetical protein